MSKSVCELSCPFSITKLRKMELLRRVSSSGVMTWRSMYGESKIGFSLFLGSGQQRMQLSYKAAGISMAYDVELTTTPCHYGGVRYWFICPVSLGGIPCRRRVGVLYASRQYFACRKCCNLAYQSQQKSRYRPLGIFGDFLQLSDEFDEKERAMRVKYWKGRPTKRYAKLLRKAQRIPTLEQLAGYKPQNLV